MKYTTIFLLVTSLLAGCSSTDDSDSTDTLDDSASTIGDQSSIQDATTTDNTDNKVLGDDSSTSTQIFATTTITGDTVADTDDDLSVSDFINTGTVGDTTTGTSDDTGTDDDSSTQGQSLALDAAAVEIIDTLAGFDLDLFLDSAPERFDSVLSTAIDSTALAPGEFSVTDREQILQLPVERVQYSCSGGGTVIVETGLLELFDYSYSHTAYLDSFSFDSCLSILDGQETMITGTISSLADSVSGNRFSTGAFTGEFTDFSMGNSLQASAAISSRGVNIEGELNNNRSVTINNLSKNVGSSKELTVTNTVFSQNFVNLGFGRELIYSMDVSGTIAGPLTDGVTVTVSSESPLQEQLDNRFPDAGGPTYAFTGQIRMSAENGAELIISTIPERSEGGIRRVDLLLLSATGEQTSSTIEFPERSFPSEE